MKVRPIVIASATVLAGCSFFRQPAPQPPAASPAEIPAAVPGQAGDAAERNAFRYRVLSPELTGIDDVFDDGKNTYITFKDAPQATLLIFDDAGQAIPFQRFSHYVIASGLHAGILVRTSTSYSYAAPLSATRVQAAKAGQGTAALPPELAAQRAIILQTQSQLASVERKLAAPAPVAGAELEAVNRELDEIQAVVNGLNARLVRLYFASGRSNLTMSATAEAALKRLALQSTAITIKGRTDNIGPADVNQRVAWARANAARQLLQRMGVPSASITVDRAAQTDYIADNKTPEGRARNRRAELVFVLPEAKMPVAAAAGAKATP
jgi:outer membrane protein OmpA-like peptidoglycan-associated protein